MAGGSSYRRDLLVLFALARQKSTISNCNKQIVFDNYMRKLQKKKKIQFLLCSLAKCYRERSLWTHLRTDAWFVMAFATYDDRQWYDNFRVSRDTFQFICNQVRNLIRRKDTRLRKCVSVESRVAVTLYYLSSTSELRTIAHLFGVSKPFVCNCVKNVCGAVINKMRSQFLFMPKGDDLKEVIDIYRRKWGFPMCAGAIDGTHIPIVSPSDNHTDYVNRKGYHSVVMQAVVDSKYLFRDTVIGWPGSVHDARVLANSEIFNLGNSGRLFPPDLSENINGVRIPAVILGDPAYPLLPWLLKSYPENPNTPLDQRYFNYRLSRARMTVENTFGRWKGRFRRFLKRVDMNVKDIIIVIMASCILHNVCELYREECLQSWIDEVENSGLAQPDELHLQYEQASDDTSEIRAVLSKLFLEQRAQEH